MISLKKFHIFLFAVLTSPFLSAIEKPVVAIYPLSNPSGITWINNMGNTVNDVLSLTLALMDEYEIIRPDKAVGSAAVEDLKSLSTEMEFDDIIFGECLIVEDGFRFSLGIYDRFEDKLTIEAQRDIESVMDSFDAADELVTVLLEGLSGVHVSYGSLKLNSLRSDPFRTEINNVDIGYGIKRIDRMVTGSHIVDIYQDRGAGEELVSSFNVDVLEGEEAVIPSVVPWLAGGQAKELDQIDRSIAMNMTNGNFDRALALSDTAFLNEFRPEHSQWYKNWISYLDSDKSKSDESMGSLEILNYRAVKEFPFKRLEDPLLSDFHTNIPRDSRAFTELMTQENRPIRFIPEYADITPDGMADDWSNVSTVYQDRQDDLLFSLGDRDTDGMDIAWVGMACDEKNLYVAIQTVDKQYTDKMKYNVYFNGEDLLAISFNGEWGRLGGDWVEDQNWDNAVSFSADNSPLRGKTREIVEFSYPLSLLAEKTIPGVNGVFVEIKTKILEGNQPIDNMSMGLLIPDLYYSLQEVE